MSLSCDPFDIQSHKISVEMFREFAQLYCLLLDMDSVQNAKCSKSILVEPQILHAGVKSIQITVNLSRHCIKFTPVRVHNNTTGFIPT